MYDYPFRKSILCCKYIQTNRQSQAFQHLLAPENGVSKLNREVKQQRKLHDAVNQKNEEIEKLIEKNRQLTILVGQTETEKQKINKKYSELLMMFQQAKGGRNIAILQASIQDLVQENRILREKIKKLQRQLIESEKQLVRKIKYYEEKNEDSRKLLEKLNENILKREEKFKSELSELQSELKKKTQQYNKLHANYHQITHSYHDKQDQLTRILQETERDKSAFSENISTIQVKIQSQNNKLNEQIVNLNQQIAKLLKDKRSLEELPDKLRAEKEQIELELQELRNNVLEMQIQNKETDSKLRIAERENIDNIGKLNNEKQKRKEVQTREQNAQNQNVKLHNQINKLSWQFQEKNRQYTTILAEIEGYKGEIRQKIQQITSQQFQIRQSEKVRLGLEKDLDAVNDKNEEMKEFIKGLNKKIKFLQQLLESYKRERDEMRSENQKKWKQMISFYEGEIEKLQARLVSSKVKTKNRELSSQILTSHDFYL